ncbi:MAG: cytochrome C [Ignavibacteriales bacterium]|nr:MAG: cytochrome C [Ignavibacteriales bacterium]
MYKNLLFLFFILFLLIQNYSSAQISPGDLTNAHAYLEGLSNCTNCHVLGEQIYNSKCLDCHTEINSLIKAKRGYHSGNEVTGKNCWTCHSEHHGRNFRIVNFNPDNFNHNKTGFELKGAHFKLDCESCHQTQFIKDAEIRKRSGTYLGLDQNCISCHQDFHQGTLGENCSGCHNNEKFKHASGFNHDKSAFVLIGAHLKVDCIKCHPVEERKGETFQKFKGVAFGNCSSCHKDAHQGKFGQDCKSCHSTNSFHQINQSAFNHNKTDFPLIGKHNSVKCNDCHKQNLTVKLVHEKCTDCHKDYHKDEFTDNGIVKDCSGCHNESGFTPSLYTIEKHNAGRFKLTGSHLALPCAGCHLKNNEWHFENIGIECIDCHNNVHREEISSKFMGNNNCSGCHNTNSWGTISFEHGNTGFSLLGKHLEVSCGDCHYRGNNKDINELKFVSLEKSCLSCHKDFHYGQFNESDCERCHTFNNWEPTKFNHNKTRFSLEGAHSKLKCLQCHKVVNENNVSFIKYKMENFKCADCHS